MSWYIISFSVGFATAQIMNLVLLKEIIHFLSTSTAIGIYFDKIRVYTLIESLRSIKHRGDILEELGYTREETELLESVLIKE